MKHGWAINLGGGFHHAKQGSAEGGCIFQDVPLAIKKLRMELNNQELRVLIVDLDAHQGNGFADYAKDDPYTFIFDMYNKNEEPYEAILENVIDFNNPLDGGHLEGLFDTPTDRRVDDDYYFDILCTKLPEALKTLEQNEQKPELIIFNAGSDPHIKDPWGCMALSDGGIIARDWFVFDQARKHSIPIMMVLAGGYGPHNADLVFRSIKNIIQRMSQ